MVKTTDDAESSSPRRSRKAEPKNVNSLNLVGLYNQQKRYDEALHIERPANRAPTPNSTAAFQHRDREFDAEIAALREAGTERHGQGGAQPVRLRRHRRPRPAISQRPALATSWAPVLSTTTWTAIQQLQIGRELGPRVGPVPPGAASAGAADGRLQLEQALEFIPGMTNEKLGISLLGEITLEGKLTMPRSTSRSKVDVTTATSASIENIYAAQKKAKNGERMKTHLMPRSSRCSRLRR